MRSQLVFPKPLLLKSWILANTNDTYIILHEISFASILSLFIKRVVVTSSI